MWYGVAADAVVTVHVAYVGFVVFGQLSSLLGVLFRWAWVRSFWFRLAHVLAIAVVAAEALLAIECPITVWERDLRLLAGQPVSESTFIGRLMHDLLFYDLPAEVFTACYVTFALLVLGTFVLAP